MKKISFFLELYRTMIFVLLVTLCGFTEITARAQSASMQDFHHEILLPDIFVKTTEAISYAMPSTQSEKKWKYNYLQQLNIDNSLLFQAPEGWFPVKGNNGKKATSKQLPSSWIQKSDVISFKEMESITACWPIESINSVVGDSFINIKFSIAGDAIATINGDGAPSQTHQAHVYIKNAVVDIRDNETHLSLMLASYKPELKRLYPYGVDSLDQQVFPEKSMKGCNHQ
ncbi:hypothetical protein [Collimonas sp.]|jgi:hypothetical protein|uniref:hypothetical protein n=1 Tax=Collimonas sp. TaxID=1963772 RepID=UPI002C41DBB1|nr:hypothetical protein [Collimonas sp.]HWW07586.1 hypothetical protein [Collimonas sp.]